MRLAPYILAGTLMASAGCSDEAKTVDTDSGTIEQMCALLGEDMKEITLMKKTDCQKSRANHQKLMRIAGLLETKCRVNADTVNLAIETSRSILNNCTKK